MRRAAFSLVLLFGASLAAAGASWRDTPLPPGAVRLNRTAGNAASARTAMRLYAESLRLAPTNGPALHGLGLALLDQNRPDDALKVFRRMESMFPADPEVQILLATAVSRLPDLRRPELLRAIETARRATELRPDGPEAWHALSILLHLNGDYTAAAEAARRAVDLDAEQPSDPETTAAYRRQETACNDANLVFSPLD